MHVESSSPRTFVRAYHDVLKSTEINSNEKLVYLFLLSYQESASVESIFPSNEYIAQSLGLSVRTVIRATATLAEAGLIAKTRRFNKSNTFEVTNCHVWTCQTVMSRGDKLADYKNSNKNRDKISLEDEGQSQNKDASLSRDNDLTDREEKSLRTEELIGDKSVSGLNLDEEKSVNKDLLVTETYASMPIDSAQPDSVPSPLEDDEPLDDDDEGMSVTSYAQDNDDEDNSPLDDDGMDDFDPSYYSSPIKHRSAITARCL